MLLFHLKSEKLVIILDGKSSEHGFLKKLLFFFGFKIFICTLSLSRHDRWLGNFVPDIAFLFIYYFFFGTRATVWRRKKMRVRVSPPSSRESRRREGFIFKSASSTAADRPIGTAVKTVSR